MPIHNWKRIDAGSYHHFHQAWTIALANVLNGGVLPKGFFAMADQIIGGPIPDVVTLQRKTPSRPSRPTADPVAVAEVPPRARFISAAKQRDLYTKRANRIVIKHVQGEIIAVIEILSPGNKSSQHAFRMFVEKACELLEKGIHLLLVDLFPPSPRDPQGIRAAIWEEMGEDPFELPADKPFTVAAYCAGVPRTAYIEPVAVGDVLPEMPLFLTPESYVLAPLETTYQEAWKYCPDPIREALEPEDPQASE